MFIELNEDDIFNDDRLITEINETDPVILYFSASWCSPCNKLRPFMEELATEFSDEVDIIYIDVDKNTAITDSYFVSSVPYVVFLGPNGFNDHDLDFTGIKAISEIRERIYQLLEYSKAD